jgi:hypothetical protein
MFGLFYLGEYVNLFTNSFIIVILFSGGWWSIYSYTTVLLKKLYFLIINNGLNYSLISNNTTPELENILVFFDFILTRFFYMDNYKVEHFFLTMYSDIFFV